MSTKAATSLRRCPACCAEGKTARHCATEVIGVYECQRCGAVHGTCYLGDSYVFVLPYWAPKMTEEEERERSRYYDLTCLGSKGVERRHGWRDTVTRRIVQVG